MNYMQSLYLSAGCFFLTIILIPVSMRIAYYLGAIDNPGTIKIHSTPTPRIGGLAIYSSILVIYFLFPSLTEGIYDTTKFFIGVGISAIFILGLLDDINDLKPKVKFLFQIVSILLLTTGLYFSYEPFHFLYFAIIFILILGYTNAFNLIDGVDGLAAGITFFVAFGLLTLSLIYHQHLTIGFVSLIVGSSLGFLIFNFNPAKIFLGDCGSTLLGFSLATALSIIWLNSSNRFVIIPLLMIAGTPLLDTSYTILRRLKNKRPIFDGDRSHLYDAILQKGYTVRQTVIFFYIITLILSISGILIYILIEK